MDSKRIIVPTDFSTAADQAIVQAVAIARKAGVSLTLLHVMNPGSSAGSKSDIAVVESELQKQVEKIENEGVRCNYSVTTGSIFHAIPEISNHPENYMLVIGTHGIQGLKQKMFGADILKLVRKISIPCLIVQEACSCNQFSPIVFPVGGHEGFRQLIEATAMMAGLFEAEVHIYAVERKGDPATAKIRENILLAEKIFTERSIPHQCIKEASNIISVGYARQTLQYANATGAGLISMMSVKSEEHYYIAQADKETMINNAFNIPVLCISGLLNE